MTLMAKFTGIHARKEAAARPPFGPGFAAGIVEKIEALEIWGTEFKDPGPDYCEFRAFDADGAQLATMKVKGY